jgi:ferredoxin
MKSLILFFSQSGNTRKIAQAIARGVASRVGMCDAVPLERADVATLPDYQLIAFGSPVWAGVPPHVERFIDSAPSLSGRHAFAFCTHGAMPLRFAPAMVRILMRKGLTVLGTRGWYGSADFPFVPKPYFTDGHPDEIDLAEAEAFGGQMAESCARVLAGETGLIPPVPPMPPPRTIIPPPVPMKFNREKCLFPKCRLCMDHCRMKIINLAPARPIFPRKGCQTCFFCEYICPTGAIEADYGPRTAFEMEAARTVFFEALLKAEAEGRFRWLVPPEQIGWETPYHVLNNRHPRYVIREEDGE